VSPEPGVRLEPAAPAPAPVRAALIRGLAEYEKLTDECVAVAPLPPG
jgi:hypothetical protein